MGLRNDAERLLASRADEARSRAQADGAREAAAEPLRLAEYRELAAICVAAGVEPLTISTGRRDHERGLTRFEQVSVGWMYEYGLYSRMAFNADGEVWSVASWLSTEGRGSRQGLRPLNVPPGRTIEASGVLSASLREQIAVERVRSLAVEAAAEVLAGRAETGWIPMNEDARRAAERERSLHDR